MGLPQALASWFRKDRLGELAERIAGRSRQAVWQRIQHRVTTMQPAEARGYIRSRAAAVIREETDRLLAQEEGSSVALPERLVTLASDILIQSILTSTHVARQARPGRRAIA